ncbi:hypothetical protein CYMTET_17129 [Cymbomonas tetramitiformis]|uniref:non-specific serine/threonine protein kinase n=1 Tax=Cymbomonas tetramitiformis TaxID=36881 RepID=A0AAE0GAR6_9CHLO|nr:hypothetical protein CYMTET_17129 [Cymbomonas tetramitiformis]
MRCPAVGDPWRAPGWVLDAQRAARTQLIPAPRQVPQSLKVHITKKQRELALLTTEVQQLQSDVTWYLKTTLDSYRKSLKLGGQYDLNTVFQLVQLWFSSDQEPSYKEVNAAMSKLAVEVPSHKFVPLVHQLVARIGQLQDEGSGFQKALHELVRRLAIDHPYHTLYQVFAVSNNGRVRAGNQRVMQSAVDNDKVQAAKAMLEQLRARGGRNGLCDIIPEMGDMIEAYIKLAETPATPADKAKKGADLPGNLRKRTLHDLRRVPVLSHALEVRTSCDYAPGSFPYFHHFENSIEYVGGINLPKKIKCVGSNGRTYTQLVKAGNDDMRQDAVMEQLFVLVNHLLRKSPSTRRRGLRMTTYKVIPFTPHTGMLEWVEETTPLMHYLCGESGDGGAHRKYRPNDMPHRQCRSHIQNSPDLRQAYDHVCSRFQPVLHHFFLEKFQQPSDWFSRRLAFTRSVAVSSIVGYLVGLGDRHSSNILLDRRSAEVVHIDLGVAFEQGKLLSTPELVPFRLTRDLLDGMGVCGVEGPMRRCCEETIRVLRESKGALLTIVEVFIHDPLYKWGLSPARAGQRQREEFADELPVEMPHVTETGAGAGAGGTNADTGRTNVDAERVLLRVQQKLAGYVEGEILGVQGQVQHLMREAMDHDKLCRMFVGWAAWV